MSIDSDGSHSRAEVELGHALAFGCTQMLASAPPKLLGAYRTVPIECVPSVASCRIRDAWLNRSHRNAISPACGMYRRETVRLNLPPLKKPIDPTPPSSGTC